MIFATTGTQLPFPRLIAALDALAPSLDEPVIAQIGPDPAPYPNLETHATLTPDRFDALFAEARIVVAHAGIGTILSARCHGRPLILMPRRFEHGEHRNDHQLATARELERRAGLSVAWQTADLVRMLTGPMPEIGARPDDARPGDARPGDARPGDARPGDARPGDARPGDARPGDMMDETPLARLHAHLRTLVDEA